MNATAPDCHTIYRGLLSAVLLTVALTRHHLSTFLIHHRSIGVPWWCYVAPNRWLLYRSTRLSWLASSLHRQSRLVMLLDYAAQMKCLTQRRVLHTAIALSHLPADVHHFVLHFSHNAQRLLASITDEIKAISTRKHAKRKAKKRLDRTQQQLLKATQLIQRGQHVVDQVAAQHSDDEQGDEDELDMSRSELTVGDAEEEEGGEDITAQVEGADMSAPCEPASAVSNLDALTEQIRQLKEQMEQLARMQSGASGVSSQEDEDEDDADEFAHSESRRHGSDSTAAVTSTAAVNIPLAPPLLSFSHFGSSSSFASIPIASPMLAGDVPMAPPLTATIIPMAPPLSPATASAAAVPVAPPMDSTASWSVSPPTPTVLPSAANQLAMLAPARSALTPLSPNRPSTSAATASSTSTTSKLAGVYTRNIPGAAELSHTDLIKVAAAIKLRRTNVPRSPGGTPVKRLDTAALGSGGMGAGGIGEALRRKFQNVNGGGRTSGLAVIGSVGSGHSGHGRRSGDGDKDKENEWSTD